MYKIGTGELKMSLFTGVTYCACGKSKRINKQLALELISEFSEVSVYKVNIQKLIAFTYTSSKQLKIKCK